MNKDKPLIWDVVVIGGGPAGMMAAGRAAERGAKVLLLEKNPNVGKKLLITGGGRCNVTNAEFNTRTLLQKYNKSQQYLFSAFSQWNVKETLNFFNNRGMETKVEDHNRVFPVSNSAQSVWDVLTEYINKNKVTLHTKTTVSEIITKDKKIVGVKLSDKTIINTHAVILGTGGKSKPETGSTGDGFLWLKNLGHTVTEPDPSLVPVTLHDKWISKLAGLTLDTIKISLYQNNKKQLTKSGRILFTHVGVSGPTILNLSKQIGELLEGGNVELTLDLFPTLDNGLLNQKLQELFHEHSNKQLKNALVDLIPSTLVSVIVSQLSVDFQIKCHSVTRETRIELIQLLKRFPLRVKGLLGKDKAIVTSGGISLNEVDFKNMNSRLYKNLYLVGDILDIDRPSGGFSLQLCWTTGYVAGNKVSIYSKNNSVHTQASPGK